MLYNLAPRIFTFVPSAFSCHLKLKGVQNEVKIFSVQLLTNILIPFTLIRFWPCWTDLEFAKVFMRQEHALSKFKQVLKAQLMSGNPRWLTLTSPNVSLCEVPVQKWILVFRLFGTIRRLKSKPGINVERGKTKWRHGHFVLLWRIVFHLKAQIKSLSPGMKWFVKLSLFDNWSKICSKTLPLSIFLPTEKQLENLRSRMVVIVERILSAHLDFLKSQRAPQHIRHKFSNLLSSRSEIVQTELYKYNLYYGYTIFRSIWEW